MLDTQGPEFRIRRYEGNVELKEGGNLVIVPGEGATSAEKVYIRIPHGYTKLYDELTSQSSLAPVHILIEDGKIELEILSINPEHGIVCKVIRGGLLIGNKGLNFAKCALNVPAVTVADLSSVDFAFEMGGFSRGFQYLAQSFTTGIGAINFMRDYMLAKGTEDQLLYQGAKIEELFGVRNMEEIVSGSYFVMVAQGDLDAAVGADGLAAVRRRIMSLGRIYGTPVIIATGVFEGTINGFRPSRSDSVNFADALYGGASAIMFSGEITSSADPVSVMRSAVAHAKSTEEDPFRLQDFARYREAAQQLHLERIREFHRSGKSPQAVPHLSTEELIFAALGSAERMGSVALVPCTINGNSIRFAHKGFSTIPVVGITASERAFYRMLLYGGAYPVLVDRIPQDASEFFELVKGVVTTLKFAEAGQRVDVTVAYPDPTKFDVNMSTFINL